ncbi:MAG: zinc metallopeptidase [Paludibacteraceae bacterium]|nr:zinc metallopeptidase [Paludibacteraceae bacterium]
MGTGIYWIIFIGITLASLVVSKLLEYRFEKYSKVPLHLTGKEVAEKMLFDNGITDVTVVSVEGHLTDHYNPQNKTINLSADVYNTASVAAAAVAAHETGHALQHAYGYAPLRIRSALVPIVSLSSKYMSWILLLGMLLINISVVPLQVGIVLFALTTLFSFVTLPVEINASQRAVAWLERSGITNSQTTEMATDALRAAAYTYVVAALSSLATLLYYILLANSRRN